MERAIILIVDDTPDNLSMMSDVLKDDYKVRVANNGEKALKIAGGEKKPDLILLDIMMPDMDGYEVCRRLKEDVQTKNIPVIFLTAKVEEDDEKRGLELGAVDYITKPISIPIFVTRIKNHIKLKFALDFLRNQNDYLEIEVQKRTAQINAVQEVTVYALASLAETRDSETGYHIRRTQLYVQLLAKKLKVHPDFSEILTDKYINMLFKLAPLHDIGKVAIPDSVLLKPGKLTQEEFEIMKTHTTIGKRAIENAEKEFGQEMDFFRYAKELVYSHQEKWDGTGYPQGLYREVIPVSARLMAVADVYDALISKRIYKSAIPHEKAFEIIVEGRGRHFDPDMVDAFMDIHMEFKAIADKFSDKGNC